MSQNFRPYLSVDLETTGLNTDNFDPQLLEVAIVFDDMGYCNLEEQKTLHLYIKHEEVVWQNEEVEKLNKLSAFAAQKDGIPLEEAKILIDQFVEECVKLNDGYDLSIAAKNANALVKNIIDKTQILQKGISYRNIDVPTMYYLDFGYVPSFQQIAKRTGMEHRGTCLHDALFIVQAIQRKVFAQLGV